MDQKVAKLLNEQINKEFSTAYLYLQFAMMTMKLAWTALKTGTRCRLRRSGITPCCSINI